MCHLLLVCNSVVAVDFQHSGPFDGVPGLPGGSTDILDSVRVGEHALDLLEGLTCSLREHEEHVETHGGTEDTEDEVSLPLDVFERGGHKVAEGEVEEPVGRSAERDSLSADTEREEFWGVDPGDRTPGDGEGGDEEVRAGDDDLAGGTFDEPGLGGDTLETSLGSGVTLASKYSGVDVEPGHHEEGTDEESWAAAPAVDPEKGGDGHHHVDDVLDGRGDQQQVTRQIGHGEDVAAEVN